MIKLTIAIIFALIIFLIAYALIIQLKQDQDRVNARVDAFKSLYGNTNNAKQLDKSKRKQIQSRLIKEMLSLFDKKLSQIVVMILPKKMYANIEEAVSLSGGFYGYSAAGFFIFNIICVVISIFAGIMYVKNMDILWIQKFLYLVISVVVGIMVPRLLIKSKIKQRQEAMRYSMPDMLDLLCVSVQAGLSFDLALSKVVSKMRGPLIDECEILLQELRMGITRRNALQRLAKRCGFEEMQLFTAAIIQADRLGVGIAQVLEIQAENMREQRMAIARETAAKLPVKILFPTIIFIFPVIFIVVLAPAIVAVMSTFGR